MERPRPAVLRDGACLLVLVMLAFALRYHYVTTAVVDHPIRGDAVQYVQYAVNLIEHGTFSAATVSPPPPDAYRGPGYPAFLASIIALSPDADVWYGFALLCQAALGALSVALLFLAAHSLGLGTGWAIAAGLLLACWPHSITMSGYLLTETLFGALLMLASLLVIAGLKQRSRTVLALSGAAIGAASLVNPVAAPIAAVAALACWKRAGLRAALLVVALAMAPLAAWSIRTQIVVADGSPTSSHRLGQNLVQGSWPLYHAAYHAALAGDDAGKRILQDIGAEESALVSAPAAALRQMLNRIAEDPGYYAWWYLWDKPILFWGWHIRMGQGDIYVYPTHASPFSSEPWMASMASVAYGLNPILGALMLGYILLSIPALKSPAAWPSAGHLYVVGVLLGLTMLHVLLQAEPRLSIPFRPLQFLAAVAAAAQLTRMARAGIAASAGAREA